MTTTPDYAGLIERLEKVEPDTPGEGVTRYYRNPDGPGAAAALRTLLSRAEAAEARLAEALKALAEARRRARNIWGACSSDQIIDKDVERQAKLMLEYIDAARACLEKGNSDGE